MSVLLNSPYLWSGFFSSGDSPQLAEFLKASSSMRDSYRFGHTTDLGLGLSHGVESEYVPKLLDKYREFILL